MKYSLPCSCGKTTPIEISQAGQTVTCSCGQTLEIPTMRTIRQMAPVREETASSRPKKLAKWSIGQRLLFSLGLAVAAAGFIVAAYFQWGRSTLDTKEVAWDIRLDADLELLETMNLEDAWGNWVKIRDTGIGPYTPPQYIQARIISGWWKNIVVVGSGIGIGGLCLMGIAFLLPRQRPGKPRRRPPPAH